ncbi:hypothetical protein CMI42_02860 [Candidatus Pacearchaeota archaeon]|nr:hypothetical protein [Candidatus Pacearchaeota archaeon]
MKLVVDTNKLFTFFWSGSLLYKLIKANHRLFSPEFALEELKNHKPEICYKAGISSIQFDEFFLNLKKVVTFVPFEDYSEEMSRALSLIKENLKDLDFIALALSIEGAIVSDDKRLKDQSEIKILNKSEFNELF